MEETNNTEVENQTTKETGGQTSDGKENTETKKTEETEHMIPKSRFDEVNNGFKALKEELDQIKAANKEAEEERQRSEQEEAEKRGEFEQLYTKANTDLENVKAEHQTAKERVESLEGVINTLLEAKLDTIDKSYHDLIPENMTPEQKLSWVSAAEEKGLFGGSNVSEPVGEPTNPSGKQEVDVDKLNPVQMLLSGYGRK